MCKESKKSPEDAMIDELISAFVVQRIEGNGIALDDALRDSLRRCSTRCLDRITDRICAAHYIFLWYNDDMDDAQKDRGLARWQDVKDYIHAAWMQRFEAEREEQRARYPRLD